MPTNPLCDCFDIPLGLLEESHSELGQIRSLYTMSELWCRSETPLVDRSYSMTYDSETETWSSTYTILVALVSGGPLVSVQVTMEATGREPGGVIVTLARVGGALIAKWENDELWDAHRSVEMHLIDHDPTCTALRWQPRVCLLPVGLLDSPCQDVAPYIEYGIWHCPKLYVMLPKSDGMGGWDTPVEIGTIDATDIFLEWTGAPDTLIPCVLGGGKRVRVFMEATVACDNGSDLRITITEIEYRSGDAASNTSVGGISFTGGAAFSVVVSGYFFEFDPPPAPPSTYPAVSPWEPYALPVLTDDPTTTPFVPVDFCNLTPLLNPWDPDSRTAPCWSEPGVTWDVSDPDSLPDWLELSYADAPITYVCHRPRTTSDTDDPCGGTCTWVVVRNCHDLDSGTYVYHWSLDSDGCGGRCDAGKKCHPHPPYAIDPTPLTEEEASVYPDHDLNAELGVPQEGSCSCAAAYVTPICQCIGSSQWTLDRDTCEGGYIYKWTLVQHSCEGDCCAPKIPSFPVLPSMMVTEVDTDLEPSLGKTFVGDCECGATYTPAECGSACEDCDDVMADKTFTIGSTTYVMVKGAAPCGGDPCCWSSGTTGASAQLAFNTGVGTWEMAVAIEDPMNPGSYLTASYTGGSDPCDDPITLSFSTGDEGYSWPSSVVVDNA